MLLLISNSAPVLFIVIHEFNNIDNRIEIVINNFINKIFPYLKCY